MPDTEKSKPPKPAMYDLFLMNVEGSIVETCIAGVMSVFGKSKDEAVNVFLASRIAPGGYLGRYNSEVAEMRRRALGEFAAKAKAKIGVNMVDASKFDKIVNPDLDQGSKKKT